MIFSPKKDSKVRKTILLVDNKSELEQSIKLPLSQLFDSTNISALLVRAKDGPEAASKSENQKFDLLLIDSDVPRLMDGGFIHGIHTFKNTQDAEVMVMSSRESAELPEELRQSLFLKKPVDPSQLLQAMTDIINSQIQEVETKNVVKGSKYAVDVRVINAIITSTTKVLQQFGCSTVTMGQALPHSPDAPLIGDISSVVDIQSQSFHGYLCISFEKASFLEVVSLMLMEEQTELTQDNQDAVGEINNIIFGNAKPEITSYGIQMTVPRVLSGQQRIVPAPAGSAGMLIPFSTEKGRFYITVAAYPSSNP